MISQSMYAAIALVAIAVLGTASVATAILTSQTAEAAQKITRTVKSSSISQSHTQSNTQSSSS